MKNKPIIITHKYLIEEWGFNKNDILPDEISFGSHKKIWWKCIDGHMWQASVCDRVRGTNCPYCSHQKVLLNNSLLFLNPDLSKEWDIIKNEGLSPKDVNISSSKKVWWICKKCNSSWKAHIYHRSNGKGCPFCSGQKVNETNSLANLYPELIEEWDFNKNDISPYEISYGSGRQVYWICKICGFKWKTSITNRTSANRGCSNCSKRISKNCSKWLDDLNIKIREYYININNKRIYVDGFDPDSNTVYEYFGNFWHGNPEFYDPEDIHPIINKKFGDLYRKTINKIESIKLSGYNIIYIWGI